MLTMMNSADARPEARVRRRRPERGLRIGPHTDPHIDPHIDPLAQICRGRPVYVGGGAGHAIGGDTM